MPFDGINYGTLPLTAPLPAHPDATAVGAVGRDGLAGAYMFARRQARLISHQTYGHYLRNPGAYYSVISTVNATSLQDLAEFYAWVPAYATHIIARIHYRVVAAGLATVRHRVVADDGGSTDTGTTAVVDIEPLPEGEGSPGSLSELERVVDCEVALSNALSGTPGDITITVQGFAVDEAAAALDYAPLLVSVFWEARG